MANVNEKTKPKEAPMKHASGIDAFLGDDPQTPMREELGLPIFADNDGIRSFLSTSMDDPRAPLEFTDMGLTASGMANPLWDGPLPTVIKVGSIDQLFARGFLRHSGDSSHLVHKSDRDLWRLSQTDGVVVIERLFDDVGNPLKG